MHVLNEVVEGSTPFEYKVIETWHVERNKRPKFSTVAANPNVD